jgi:hypothetical protein
VRANAGPTIVLLIVRSTEELYLQLRPRLRAPSCLSKTSAEAASSDNRDIPLLNPFPGNPSLDYLPWCISVTHQHAQGCHKLVEITCSWESRYDKRHLRRSPRPGHDSRNSVASPRLLATIIFRVDASPTSMTVFLAFNNEWHPDCPHE